MSSAKKCKVCSSDFGILRWRNECPMCCKTVCSKCLITPKDSSGYDFEYIGNTPFTFNDKIEPICAHCFASPIVRTFIERYDSALDNASDGVKFFSENYRGKIPPHGNSIAVMSDSFRDKNDVIKQLKIEAMMQGRSVLFKVKIEQETNRRGNYHYSIWRGKGLAAIKK